MNVNLKLHARNAIAEFGLLARKRAGFYLAVEAKVEEPGTHDAFNAFWHSIPCWPTCIRRMSSPPNVGPL